MYVNIRDFLEAVARGQPVPRQNGFRALRNHTLNNRRFYSRNKVESGSPLSALLRDLM